jgi:hypothetical protein
MKKGVGEVLATWAQSAEFDAVDDVAKALGGGHFLRPRLNHVCSDFHGFSTLTTDQVMVMGGAAVAIGTFTITASDEVNFLRVNERT